MYRSSACWACAPSRLRPLARQHSGCGPRRAATRTRMASSMITMRRQARARARAASRRLHPSPHPASRVAAVFTRSVHRQCVHQRPRCVAAGRSRSVASRDAALLTERSLLRAAPLDSDAFLHWFGAVLRGAWGAGGGPYEVFRAKGVLRLAGRREKVFLQGMRGACGAALAAASSRQLTRAGATTSRAAAARSARRARVGRRGGRAAHLTRSGGARAAARGALARTRRSDCKQRRCVMSLAVTAAQYTSGLMGERARLAHNAKCRRSRRCRPLLPRRHFVWRHRRTRGAPSCPRRAGGGRAVAGPPVAPSPFARCEGGVSARARGRRGARDWATHSSSLPAARAMRSSRRRQSDGNARSSGAGMGRKGSYSRMRQ